MKTVFLGFIAAVISFFIGVTASICPSVVGDLLMVLHSRHSSVTTEDPHYRVSLKWQVQQAKARGEYELVQYSTSCSDGYTKFDEATKNYTIVVVEMMDQRAWPTTDSIVGLQRFRVIDTISRDADFKFWYELPIDEYLAKVPDWYPVGWDTMLLASNDGSVIIDGVTVTHLSDRLRFSVGKKYLLFVELDSRGVGIVPNQRQAFEINEKGRLSSVAPVESDLSRKLASRFGNSLDRFRSCVIRKSH